MPLLPDPGSPVEKLGVLICSYTSDWILMKQIYRHLTLSVMDENWKGIIMKCQCGLMGINCPYLRQIVVKLIFKKNITRTKKESTNNVTSS